jgi:hypothetical protein
LSQFVRQGGRVDRFDDLRLHLLRDVTAIKDLKNGADRAPHVDLYVEAAEVLRQRADGLKRA